MKEKYLGKDHGFRREREGESRNVPGLGRLRFERSEEGWLGFMAPLYVCVGER